jgi:ATP-dependent Clp protease protease subunit
MPKKREVKLMKIKIKGVIISNDYKWIYDWFEIDSTCPKDIEKQLEKTNDNEEIELEINSPGGDVYAGSEIYTALMQYTGNIIAKVVGIAASAASVIAMAADKILISPTAQIMIHNVWSWAEGDYRTMEHEAGVLKGWNKSIANAYMLKTGMSQTELLNLMNKTTWLTAQEAVKYKFADEIMFDEAMQLAAGMQNGMLPPKVIDKIRNLIKGDPQKLIDMQDFDPKKLAETLRTAPRSGEPADYIMISDTLATQIANFFDQSGAPATDPEAAAANPVPDVADTADPPQVTDSLQTAKPQTNEPVEASRQVPVDLYKKLHENLERRARIC